MAKIALCAFCNTAVILKSWVGAIMNQPGMFHAGVSGAPITDRPTGNTFGQVKDTETGELFTVPDFTTCRCGVTMAYYDDEDIAMVTPTCVVFGCDTDQLRLSIQHANQVDSQTGRKFETPRNREVKFYRIDSGERTRVFQPHDLFDEPNDTSSTS